MNVILLALILGQYPQLQPGQAIYQPFPRTELYQAQIPQNPVVLNIRPYQSVPRPQRGTCPRCGRYHLPDYPPPGVYYYRWKSGLCGLFGSVEVYGWRP